MKEKLEITEMMNDNALEALEIGDFLTAQNLFRQNAKSNPCFITLNNLGVFYVSEGMVLQNGKMRNASKLGLKYLKMAENYFRSHLNLMAIGEGYFNIKEYKLASEYFRHANRIRNLYTNYNNWGVSLYMQCKYVDASKCFKKALALCNDYDYYDIYPAKSNIFYSYAFSLLQYDKMKCSTVLKKLIHSNISHIVIDEFILAYFCNDFQLAEKFIENMLDTWKLDIPVIAMVFDCLFKLKKNDVASKYLRLQIELLEGYEYDIRREINCVKQVFTKSDCRDKVINEYRYVPSIMTNCYYINCKKHV